MTSGQGRCAATLVHLGKRHPLSLTIETDRAGMSADHWSAASRSRVATTGEHGVARSFHVQRQSRSPQTQGREAQGDRSGSARHAGHAGSQALVGGEGDEDLHRYAPTRIQEPRRPPVDGEPALAAQAHRSSRASRDEDLTPLAPEGPLGRHDYEIALVWGGAPLCLTISGRCSKPLAVGDTYTLWRPGMGIEDVTVTSITREADGWTAHCEVAELAPP